MIFLGEFEHALDERGRLAVPAKFRSGLAGGVVITRGFDRCLVLWPIDEWRQFSERVTQPSFLHADVRRVQRLLFSGATDTTPDRLGRILIPAFLRGYAELEDTAVIIGVHNRIEVWNPDRWRLERAAAEDDSSRLAQQLFELGVPR